VTEVELRRGRETLKLRREGDGWQIVEPVKARGDRSRIDETLVTLTSARVDREIASAPTQVAEFGLDKPGAEVTLRLKDGRQLALTLGAKCPTGLTGPCGSRSTRGATRSARRRSCSSAPWTR